MSESTPSRPADQSADPGLPFRYTAALADTIERRWQDTWDSAGAFRQPNPGDPGFDAGKPKFYCLDMFPYPSGAGLHVGHPEGYTATDIISRLKRMTGHNVLHPMGWDAFGLPAEQYAIQTGIHPAITTARAIENFKRQLRRFGFSYDWSREISTIDPGYYRWTQWIFLKLYDAWFDPARQAARPIADLTAELESGQRPAALNPAAHEHSDAEKAAPARPWASLDADARRRIIDSYRLAYLGETTVNWCPKLGTVLANDEVIEGKSERGGHPVVRRPLKQWMFRITAYAERLIAQLDGLDWSASTKTMQREWIGRSEGAEIEFELEVGRLSEPAPTHSSSPSSSPSSRAHAPHPADSDTPFAARWAPFVARDPYPPGEPSPTDLLIQVKDLPHIELAEATYFVTWRTSAWRLNAQSRAAVLRALLHFDGDRCDVAAACVMDTHVHWLVKPRPGHSIRDLVASIKRFSATEVNKIESVSGPLWLEEQFDHIVRDERWLGAFVRYIARNPIEAKAARSVSDYAWTYVSNDVRTYQGAPLAVGPKNKDESQEGGVGAGSESRPTTQRPTSLRVFTTRPDTLFGATYMVVAPEHPLVSSVLASDDPVIPAATRDALRAYVARAASRSDIDRQEAKEKTGVFTGFSAINPATGKAIPVWTSDYVLMGYGTGAIMAVPAHDERDAEFARAHNLPIIDVVYPSPVIAARYFALHAYEHSDPDPTWREQLADMLGLATTGAPHLPHAELLEIVFNRRTRPPEPVCEVGVPGARRGGTKAVWLEFIDELGLRDFHDLRQRFASAGYHAARRDAFAEPGIAANSANAEVSLDGLHTPEAKARIIEWLARTGRGRSRLQHKLRDWTFSRQRYWGEPFPIVFDDAGRHYPVGPDALPVTLPDLADYMPVESDTPTALLAKATSWARTTAGAAGVSPRLLDPRTPVTRECNTMPGSAGSSWYFMRYCDAGGTAAPASGIALAYWLGGKAPGVDLYLGGSEHAVGHLLYSRFWNNVLFDLGLAPAPEPFRKLFHQGMITSFAYQRADKTLVPTDEVTEVAEGRYTETKNGQPVTQIVAKMSKSLKNVVNPDDVIAQFGADTFRLYEMYMGPLEASKPWNPRDISGLFRFLQRAWRLAIREDTGLVKAAPAPDEALDKLLHRLIVKVRADIERISLNTAIAAMIEFVNAGVSADKGQGALTHDQLGTLALVLCPFAPHMAEELWHRLGRDGLASLQPWPAHDPAKLTDDSVEVPVQVAGKVRGRVMVPAGADAKAHEALALADAKVQEFIAGKPIRKIIVVPGKMVNVVV